MATATQINEIIKLYVGYYNRAPDPAGLNFWIKAFDGGFGLDAMAVDFSTQAETLKNYPFFLNASPSRTEYESFLTSVYANLFARPPDAPGLEFWAVNLVNKTFNVGEVISQLIEGAVTSPDKDVVANKVAAGLDFYIKANALPPYTFDADDIAAATEIQKNVTADPASVTAASAATDTYIAGLGAVSINLTSLIDQPGGGGGAADTQGGAGPDTYEATFDASGGTLSNSDSIAAGGGVDTLNLRVTNLSSQFLTVAPSATDLEKVFINNQDSSSGFFTLDFNAISGETEVWAKNNSLTPTTFTAATNMDLGTKVGMQNISGSFVAGFKGDKSGTADAFSLTVDSSGTKTTSAFFWVGTPTTNDQSMEVANITTQGTQSFLNASNLSLTTINVSGTAKLVLEDTGTNFAGVKTIDASAMTAGGLFIDASANTEADLAFTGSGFDDMVNLNNSIFNSSGLTLDGGAGTDILGVDSFNAVSATNVNKANGFEVLQANNASTSLAAGSFTKINTFIFDGNSTGSSRTNITGIQSDDRFVFTSDVGSGDETLRLAADTAGQTAQLELRAQEGSGGEVRIIANTNTGNDYSAVGFANNISTVQLSSTGTNATANLIKAEDSGSNNYFAFGNQGGPSTFTLSGNQDLTIAATAGESMTASSDVRGFEAGVSFDAGSFSGSLRIAGSGSTDALKGGSGNDIIYGLGGNDVLTGNGGSDQFRFSDWNNATAKIDDFASGTDKVGLQRVDFQNTTATQAGATLNSADYVSNLSAVANMSSAESKTIVELQAGATANQITQTTNTAQDAYLLVFNQGTGKGELWYDSDWSTTSGRSQTAEFSNITSLVELTGLTNNDFVEYTF
ncbi:hypothetical protein [Roseibium sp.]|uniref:hypothetical protein n=1 Tax=Roseibium sp. TaxID=1936156 RepID=UPI00329A222E